MRKQYHLYNLMVYVLIALLMIPQTYRITDQLASLLTLEEYTFLTQSKSLFTLIVILLESITILFNITILHWIYKFAKLDLNLSQNLWIYLCANLISKVMSFFIPPTYVFSVCFILIHLYYSKPNKIQLLWLLFFPILNIIFTFI